MTKNKPYGIIPVRFFIIWCFMITIVNQSRGYFAYQHNNVLKQTLTVSDGELVMYSFMLMDVDGEFRQGAFALECGDIFDWVNHG